MPRAGQLLTKYFSHRYFFVARQELEHSDLRNDLNLPKT